jgi:putative membrane protein
MPYAYFVDDGEAVLTESFMTDKERGIIMRNRKNMLFGIGGSMAVIAVVILFFGHWGYGHWTSSGVWWPMHHGYFGPGGMMGFGSAGFFSPIFWVLAVFAIVLLVAGAMSRKDQDESATKDAADSLEILKQRYARGEIDQEEFLTKRDILQKTNS